MQGQSGGVETLTKMRIQILLENFRGILQNLFYFFILILVDRRWQNPNKYITYTAMIYSPHLNFFVVFCICRTIPIVHCTLCLYEPGPSCVFLFVLGFYNSAVHKQA